MPDQQPRSCAPNQRRQVVQVGGDKPSGPTSWPPSGRREARAGDFSLTNCLQTMATGDTALGVPDNQGHDQREFRRRPKATRRPTCDHELSECGPGEQQASSKPRRGLSIKSTTTSEQPLAHIQMATRPEVEANDDETHRLNSRFNQQQAGPRAADNLRPSTATAAAAALDCNPDHHSDNHSIPLQFACGREQRLQRNKTANLAAPWLPTSRCAPPTSSSSPSAAATSFARDLPAKVLSILLISIILGLSSNNNHLEPSSPLVSEHQHDQHHSLLRKLFTALPRIIVAEASECSSSIDCDKEKICHENKCICNREKPIEDKERQMCLVQALLNEPCVIDEQCLGKSKCLDGVCSCSEDHVSIFNPSIKINYCHPKRGINQQCSHDAQCPADSFCGGERTGCLCQNGFGASNVSDVSTGRETVRCLPKTCSQADQCESIYHLCEDYKCKCLATHFDPHTAKCYKFGSTGGKPADGSADEADSRLANLTKLEPDCAAGGANAFFNSFNDLIGFHCDQNRLLSSVILTLVVLFALLLIVLLALLIRRHYAGYCWTMSKIGYEPNNQTARPQAHDAADHGDPDYFSKNSIKNKSFRKKRNLDGEETDDDNQNETAADESSLVTTSGAGKGGGPLATAFGASPTGNGAAQPNSKSSGEGYVRVDMVSNGLQNGGARNQAAAEQTSPPRAAYGNHFERFHHQVVGIPLASSTSTPV